MKIRLAVFTAFLAAFCFPGTSCFAQTAGPEGSGARAAERAELQRRVSAEIRRLKAVRPSRYVENADFAVDPAALKDKQVVVFGFGSFAAAKDGLFTLRIGDSFSSSPWLLVDFSGLSKETKKKVLQADFPSHLWTVHGTWKYSAGGGSLVAAEISDFGEARFCSALSDCLSSPAGLSPEAEQAGLRSRVSAELQRLKTETPRRYVENVDFAVDPQAYADKRVVVFGFGNFSSSENGIFTVRIADSFGGSPGIIADYSTLSKETKKALLKTNYPPHLLLIDGIWRKTPAGWRLFAQEARDFGETRFCSALPDCQKAP